MFTEMKKRRYTLKRRAESREATHLRIVEAAALLHETLGPKTTTISAVAEAAGVQRLTVYRHFPDEAALFRACTSHWLAQHPPPEPGQWDTVADPTDRALAALTALYRYYRRTRRMWEQAYADEKDVPALRAPMHEFRAYLVGMADSLARPIDAGANSYAVIATLRHAVHFATWASLSGQGLRDEQAAELAASWIAGAIREN